MSHKTLADNPIFERLAREDGPPQTCGSLIVSGLLILLAAVLVLVVSPNAGIVVFLCLLAFVIIAAWVGGRVAATTAQDNSDQAYDLLRLSLLTPQQVVVGYLAGLLYRQRLALLTLALLAVMLGWLVNPSAAIKVPPYMRCYTNRSLGYGEVVGPGPSPCRHDLELLANSPWLRALVWIGIAGLVAPGTALGVRLALARSMDPPTALMVGALATGPPVAAAAGAFALSITPFNALQAQGVMSLSVNVFVLFFPVPVALSVPLILAIPPLATAIIIRLPASVFRARDET